MPEVVRCGIGDAELVERIAAREEDALAEAYERHGASVHELARHLYGEQCAADVVHAVILHLWHEPGAVVPRGSLRSHLLAQTCSPSGARRTWAAIDARAAQDRTRVREAIHGLDEAARDAVVLTALGRCSVAETAAVLCLPERTVASRIRAGLLQLRVHLGDVRAPGGIAPSPSVEDQAVTPLTSS